MTLRRLLASTLFCAACSEPARETRPAPRPVARAAPEPAPVLPADNDGVALAYRPQAEGRTMIEVREPDGASVRIFDGPKLVNEEIAPLAVEALADHWYRVSAHLPSGALREKKVKGQAGQVATLSFTDAGVRGPVALTPEELLRLISALDQEEGDKTRLSILETAARHAWFTSAQAGALIDHVVHRDNKLLAVPVLKDRILDKENAFLLYQHFTYRDDKARVQDLLER
jgi:Domain of unknown function (DUF4476)